MPRPLKILMILLAVPLLGVAIALVYATTKPSTWRVESTFEIAAPSAAVHAAVSRPRSWPEWSAWDISRDSTLQSTFDGPDSGEGAAWVWSGEALGNGRLLITRSEPPALVEYDLFFERGESPGRGTITLAPIGDGGRTRMTWVDEGSVGSGPLALIGRLMIPTIEAMLAADFEAGMRKLDARARAGELQGAAEGETVGEPR